ncbi:MAG: hypothetical protein ABGZ35_13700 [Planctomycetaceae bacterium]|jgi:flagellar protein FliS
MNPHQQYRRNSSFGWTRIDMLIHIYNHAINSLQGGAELLEAGASPEQLIAARMDAQKKILLISDGLAVEQGGSAVQVMRLCVFALDQIRTDSAQSWQSAARVLSTVREGFVEVQDTVRAAEQAGEIPPLVHTAS